jgi:hypothetical protein
MVFGDVTLHVIRMTDHGSTARSTRAALPEGRYQANQPAGL